MIPVSSLCFRDLTELKFVLKNTYLISYHFYPSSWWNSQQAYHRQWYLDVFSLNYFYGDPICSLITIVDNVIASSVHHAWQWASSFHVSCGDFWSCRLILMLAKVHTIYMNSYGKISPFLLFHWLLWLLSPWLPINVMMAWCPHWTIMLLAKQDITFQKQSI